MASRSKVQHEVRLHEKVVQRLASGQQIDVLRTRTPGGRRYTSPVVTLTPDQDVWRRARAIVSDPLNSYSRIEVESETDVVVR
jgi:hypothetical protein